MADNEREITIVLRGKNLTGPEFQKARQELAGLSSATKDTAQNTDRAEFSVRKLAAGYVAGALTLQGITTAGRAFVGFMRDSVAAAAESERVQTRLVTALRAQGLATKPVIDLMGGLASEFARTTVHSDDLIVEMESLLFQVGNVAPGAMKAALTASTNLAAGLGIDLRTATKAVADAMVGKIKSLQSLVPELKNAKIEAGDTAGIIEFLNSKFSGQAAAELNTYTGQVEKLADAWDEVQEAAGNTIIRDAVLRRGMAGVATSLNAVAGGTDKAASSFTALAVSQTTVLGPVLAWAINWLNRETLAAEQLGRTLHTLGGIARPVTSHLRAIAPVSSHATDLFAKLREEVEQLNADALSPLNTEQRELVLGFQRVGVSTKDIAEKLGLAESAVRRVIDVEKRATESAHRHAEAVQKQTQAILAKLRADQWSVQLNQRLYASMVTNLPGGALPRGVVIPQLTGDRLPTAFVGLAPAVKGSLPSARSGFLGSAFGGSQGFGSLLGGTALQALTGGGNLASSLGGAAGSALTGQLAKVLTGGAGTAIKGAMGGLLNAVLPGIGALAGPLLGKVFGGLFGKSENRKQDEAATAQIASLKTEFFQQLGGESQVRGLEKLFGDDVLDTFGNKGRKGLENVKADIEAFTGKVNALKSALPEVTGLLEEAAQFGGQLPERFGPVVGQLREMGLIQGEQSFNWKHLKESADRYGIEIEKLGPKFQGARLGETARDILTVFEEMKSNGADVGAVVFGMREEISALVQDSLKFGTTIPENMRPLIQELMRSGSLLDENGDKMTDISGIQFGEPIKVGLDAVVDRLDRLLEGLGIKLPEAVATGVGSAAKDLQRLSDEATDAIARIPRRVDIEIASHGGITGGFYGQEDIEVPGAAAGGLFAKPTFRVIAEREPEVTGSPNVIVKALATAMRETGLSRPVTGGTRPAIDPKLFDLMSSEIHAMRGDIGMLPFAIQRAVRDGILLTG